MEESFWVICCLKICIKGPHSFSSSAAHIAISMSGCRKVFCMALRTVSFMSGKRENIPLTSFFPLVQLDQANSCVSLKNHPCHVKSFHSFHIAVILRYKDGFHLLGFTAKPVNPQEHRWEEGNWRLYFPVFP